MFQVKNCLLTCAAVAVSTVLSAADIHLAGDSTCATYALSRKPLTGWGQVLQNYCKSGVHIVNMAQSGCSTKSYRDLGVWDKMLAAVKPGDFVVIQFGHNNRAKDLKRRTTMPEFKADMSRFVQEVKAKKAYPVLATPIAERQFKKGEFLGGSRLQEYSQLIKDVGKEEKVPVIDLNAATRSWIVAAGESGSQSFYMSGSGEKKYERDNTHLTFAGATHVAEMFITIAQDQKLPIGGCFETFKK